jgi:hypothetical protein
MRKGGENRVPIISFEVTDSEFAQLKKVLGDGTAERLAHAALMEWLAWITARDRPLSISQLETKRVMTLYADVLRESVLPSEEHMGSVLQLPLGEVGISSRVPLSARSNDGAPHPDRNHRGVQQCFPL